MRKKREYIEGAAYHVTSRMNDKKRVFECNVGRKTMLLVLRDAKDKFGFKRTAQTQPLLDPEGAFPAVLLLTTKNTKCTKRKTTTKDTKGGKKRSDKNLCAPCG
ncbi:MAG: hypothetical protein LBQ88_21685 [Treponema sp.]|nr:hypothetical protein [Treponema sp.]